jgi:hypothetical protein
MSSGPTVAGPQGGQAPREEGRWDEYGEPPGYGWVIFAGVMIFMAGTISVIYGIAAIANSNFYVANTRFIFSDLKTWGWVVMLIGILEMCVAVGIWAQAAWARWTGVAIAGLNAIAQVIFIAAYPWLSLAVFTLDVLVIYGLVAHGGRLEEA